MADTMIKQINAGGTNYNIHALQADKDGNGNNIIETYLPIEEPNVSGSLHASGHVYQKADSLLSSTMFCDWEEGDV